MMNILHKILKSFNKNNNTPELHLTSTFSTYNQRNDCYKILLQQKETETLVTEVNIKIDKINELVLIANTTIDRKEFYSTIEEISKIFTELLDYEYKLDFPYSPSDLLKDFENKQENWIKLLEQRINIKENHEAKTKSVTINNMPDEISSNSKENTPDTTRDLNSDMALDDLDKENMICINSHEDESESSVNSYDVKELHPCNNEPQSLQYNIDENINQAIEHKSNLPESEPQNDLSKIYMYPSLALLNKHSHKELPKEELKSNALKILQVLFSFGIDAEIVDIFLGARFTRFEIQLGTGVRIKDVLHIKDDILLSLEAVSLHITAPIPGKTTIGIDVENKELSTVTLRSILESNEFNEFPSNLAIAIGKDISGNVIVDSLDNMYHLLIGGTTGSGKSIFINSVLMSILYKASPADVKLILIDTLGVNMSIYNHIPHLLSPVLTDSLKASAALRWCVGEMKERYNRFTIFDAKDLKSYNKAIEKHPCEDTFSKLPRIVIVIDDFSDLMIAFGNIIEENICKLAQMGRACGIHLIISTQRPSVDVITGTIKANLPTRIAFKVFSAIDSKTILDRKGAEDLLSDGDMLFYPQCARAPMRIQGTFVSDNEVCAVLDFLKNQKL